MNTRHALQKRTEPQLQVYASAGSSDVPSSTERQLLMEAHKAKPAEAIKRHGRNGLQWVIIALLLALLVLDRKAEVLALFQLPVATPALTTAAPLKAPTEVVKQRYQRLVQEMAYQKAAIKNAKQSIELTQQNLDRFMLELSAHQSAVDALKAEYDVAGLAD